MEDLLNKIHLMDNMELMAQLPDKSIDLAIVDPPYGIGEDGAKNNSRGSMKVKPTKYISKGWDRKIPDKDYFIELSRVSRNQIIWGGNYFIEHLKNTSCMIVWDKNNGNTDFADCELAWTSFKTAVRKFKFTWNGYNQENMKQKEIRIHPTQKPVALYRWLLTNYAKEGDIILDTNCGSASSVIACIEEKHQYIACENDSDYHKDSLKRIQPYLDQGNLF